MPILKLQQLKIGQFGFCGRYQHKNAVIDLWISFSVVKVSLNTFILIINQFWKIWLSIYQWEKIAKCIYVHCWYDIDMVLDNNINEILTSMQLSMCIDCDKGLNLHTQIIQNESSSI